MNILIGISQIFELPDRLYNAILLRRKKVTVGRNFKINGKLIIHRTGEITIGDNTIINSSRSSNPIGGDMQTILVAEKNAQIIIGDGVGISNSCIWAKSSVTIEDNVIIGGNCKIYDTDFHSIIYINRIKGHLYDPDIKTKPIIIHEGAFVGAHSIILKGVSVGKHSVIGAGSVVTKSVPDYQVWGGNPAKYIGTLEDLEVTELYSTEESK